MTRKKLDIGKALQNLMDLFEAGMNRQDFENELKTLGIDVSVFWEVAEQTNFYRNAFAQRRTLWVVPREFQLEKNYGTA